MEVVSMRFLEESFIEKYKNSTPPFTELGKFVYYRTYSRWLEDKGRRENWFETCERVVNYSLSLEYKHRIKNSLPVDIQKMKKEAETLFDNMFNLRQFPSGRSMWVGGTIAAEKYPTANFNCSGLVLNSFYDFIDLFYLLMVGTGVGIRILKEDAEKFENYRANHKLIALPYNQKKKHERLEWSILDIVDTSATIYVGDSKEGFVGSLKLYFDLIIKPEYNYINTIKVNFDSVRPKGERLKTFGGTASGHENLKTMFLKVYKVLKNAGGKLKPIDILDIANIIGENVVSGGVRRTSEICLSDDEEIIKAKQNIYSFDENGNLIVNTEILHRTMSNNSIYFTSKPSREYLHEILQSIKNTGEPGFINAEAAKKRRQDFQIINPCFTGDMKLLTINGYKTFAELKGKEVELINKDGQVSRGKVWCSGIKPIVRLKLSNRKIIKCTPDHVFMTMNGNAVEAKDLQGKKLIPYLHHINNNVEYIRYGFIQGDGELGRLKSKEHTGLEVNIGKNDEEIKPLFGIDINAKGRRFYIQNINDTLRRLGFSAEPLPNRVMPSTYNSWTLEQKAGFLKGCFSANGSVINTGRITFKTTSKIFAQQLVETLANDFGIKAYITTNKRKKVKFSNGEYECKESYDINIQNYDSRLIFYNMIGFVQSYKMNKLKEILIKQAPTVKEVIDIGEVEEVYDFSEPITHWGVVEGVIVHNCAEVLLKNKQLCNLTTVNAKAFIKSDLTFDEENFIKAMRLSARIGLRMTLVDLELPDWDKNQKDDRLVGASITGWQDMVDICKLTREQQINILKRAKAEIRDELEKYANELKVNVPLLATTVKPEGTISQLPTVSSGLHYSHSPYYIRRVRINAHDTLCKVAEELGWNIYPEVGQDWETCTTKVIEFPVASGASRTKYDVSAIEQLENYKMFMEHYVEHNASITVTVKEDEWDDVEQWLWDNWDIVVGITFISLDNNVYPLAPYEQITKEKYEEMKLNMKPFDETLLLKYEKVEEEHEISDDECATGACPIR
jgi:intein/homing endonuclease